MDTIKDWIGRLMGQSVRKDRAAHAPQARDYRSERETDPAGGMGADDQAWEKQTIQRNRDAQATSPGEPESQ